MLLASGAGDGVAIWLMLRSPGSRYCKFELFIWLRCWTRVSWTSEPARLG